MAERPILFSAPMVRALLAGTKTQTRRVLSIGGHKIFTEFGPSDTIGYDWHFRDSEKRWHDLREAELKDRLRFQVGDRLYVREAWRTIGSAGMRDATPPRDLQPGNEVWYEVDGVAPSNLFAGKFRPPMFMPKWMSRITLPVSDVRVQRLQDISEEDAIAEGIVQFKSPSRDGRRSFGLAGDVGGGQPTAVKAYAALWDDINGPGSWEANPWVVPYTFGVHHGNIDHIGEVA